MKINVIILHEDAFVAPSVCALPVDAFHQNIRGTLSVCRAH